MKFLIMLLISTTTFAQEVISPENAKAYTAILEAQALALDQIDAMENTKALPFFGFRMSEMVTDIGFTKNGLLGLSALKSYNGVEVKWKRPSGKLFDEEEAEVADIVVEGEASESELRDMSASIEKMVRASGKVKDHRYLKSNIYNALTQVNDQIKRIEVTSINGWKANGLRLDLTFDVAGKVWFFVKAGVALRLRMEWKLKDMPLTRSKDALVNNHTKFVVKTLAGLDAAIKKRAVQGFEAKKILIGVGASRKSPVPIFTIWKWSAGFVGWLQFAPVPKTKMVYAAVPTELLNEDFEIGEDEAEGNEKGLWPFRKRKKVSRQSFVSGMDKSVQRAAFFAEQSNLTKALNWKVQAVKTVNDIQETGLWGLTNYSARGVVEIDFERKI